MSIDSAHRSAAVIMAAALIAAQAPVVTAQSLTAAAEPGGSGAGEVRNGLFLRGNETYRVVDAAGFPTAADLGTAEPGQVVPIGFHEGCGSCGTHGCQGGCGHATAASLSGCGPCGSGGYGHRHRHGYAAGLTNPCAPCNPFYYVSAETLYMDNDGIGRFSLSRDFSVDDYGFELGSRITIGSAPDCVHGYEITFVGPFEWDSGRRFISGDADGAPDGDNDGEPIDTRLIPGGGISLLDISSFADFSEFTPFLGITNPEVNFISTAQEQRHSAEFWSLEVNRTLFAGEYAKLVFGGRYASYDENFSYSSFSPGVADRPAVPPQFNPITGDLIAAAIPALPGRPAGSGILVSLTENDLYGLQVGMDLLYPVCCYGFADFRLRLGAFINDAQNQYVFANVLETGDEFIDSAADDTTGLAGLIEIGAGVRYQIGEILSVRAGAELWYLTEIASATTQFGNVISFNSGRRTQNNDDVLMTGVSVGAELRY